MGFEPYDNSGGTCIAVAGEEFVVVAADTRMSTGFNILSRNHPKTLQLSERCVIATSGFDADAKALQKHLKADHVQYRQAHGKEMGCVAAAQLLSNTLYFKRFFPYYTFNLLAGIDKEGKGAVFTYDAVGSYERTNYSCQGTGRALIESVLDNQLKLPSPLLVPKQQSAYGGSEGDAVDLVKDAFASAAERDIYTGDQVEIVVINKDGTRRELMELKRD
uniref:Proteasome subunit beta n=1 Tax=Prasinoderma singulare TaxID=676789 RepID=A0A7S3BZQ5_9VIRI|mmetsp:Transcript_6884/g.20737  ORF Transcript_6884/g.20737 Transcript_6884/m.20737 type:complete len:219 (+) Transcript_6884:88-744(+)